MVEEIDWLKKYRGLLNAMIISSIFIVIFGLILMIAFAFFGSSDPFFGFFSVSFSGNLMIVISAWHMKRKLKKI